MSRYSADVTVQSDLVGYWRCTDASGATITDFAANPHNGTKGAGVSLGSASLVSGAPDTSSAFDGSSNAYVDLGPSGEIFFHSWNVSTPFTVEAIVVPNLGRSAYQECDIFGKQDSNPTSGAAYRGFAAQVVYGQVSDKTVAGVWLIDDYNSNRWMRTLGSTDLANGSEYHITWSYDGSGTPAGIQLWVNGVLETGLTIQTGANGNPVNIIQSIHPYIGSRGGGANYFSGNIQELAIYNTYHGSSTYTRGDTLPLRHTSFRNGRSLPSYFGQKPNIWFDNDTATDIDNYTGFARIAQLHVANQIKCVGVSICDSSTYGAPAIRALLNYYGAADIPLYAYQGTDMASGQDSTINQPIVNRFRVGETRLNYPAPLQALRAALNAGNLVIIAGGFASNLAALLASPANSGGDGLTTGAALITSGCLALLWCCGYTPSCGTSYIGQSPEYNLAATAQAAVNANAIAQGNWPSPVIEEGIEITTLAGNIKLPISGPPSWQDATKNPMKYAWDLWKGAGLAASGYYGLLLERLAAYGFDTVDANAIGKWLAWGAVGGTMTINGTSNAPIAGQNAGYNAFTSYASGNWSMVRKAASDAALTAVGDSFLSNIAPTKYIRADGGCGTNRTMGVQ